MGPNDIPGEIPAGKRDEGTVMVEFAPQPMFESDMLQDKDIRLAVFGMFMGRINYIPNNEQLDEILTRVDEAVSYIIGDDQTDGEGEV